MEAFTRRINEGMNPGTTLVGGNEALKSCPVKQFGTSSRIRRPARRSLARSVLYLRDGRRVGRRPEPTCGRVHRTATVRPTSSRWVSAC